MIPDDVPLTDLMHQDVVCVSAQADLREVVRTLRERRCSCAVVVDGPMPVGIITEQDLVGVLSILLERSLPDSLPVGEFMSAPLVTLQEQSTYYEALVISRTRGLGHLPVVDRHGKLVGLITRSDLINAHFHLLDTQRELIERATEARTRELRTLNTALQALSLQDSLMGIGNRRAMEVDLEHTHAAALRYERPYTVLLLDVDYFKLYNDHYGHVAGDAALKGIAAVLKEGIRSSDRLYRYGGEELLLLLPETTGEGAGVLAWRLVQSVAERRIAHCQSPYGVVTLSGGIGGGVHKLHGTVWPDVVERADRNLYRAKREGRNRVAGPV